jgi:RNA 3'-terminal phosphate cyclase-like protein
MQSRIEDKTIHFTGHLNLRQQVICSVLSNRPIIITEIRSMDENPGLRDYEICLLRLIEKLTNGTMININKTGTKLTFRPGIMTNGEGLEITHECDLARSIVYYLEAVV